MFEILYKFYKIGLFGEKNTLFNDHFLFKKYLGLFLFELNAEF